MPYLIRILSLSILQLILVLCFADACFASQPEPWQISFQEAASPVMKDLNEFHNLLLIIISSIVFFVFCLLVYVCIRFRASANPVPATFSHNILIEVIWTVIPIIILIVIAVPSFRILKMADYIPESEVTIKIVGHQWYWNYSYPDENIQFDSYIIPDNELQSGQLRLLEVDNRLVIPENTVVKFLVTAGDVIHSFAVPSFGIKTDAVPGRTNESWVKVIKQGTYYGQCSELCGVNHGFMPIAVDVVSKEEYQRWIEQAKIKFAQNKYFKFARNIN
ncbi:MAG: cytochrome c oxidase subunit II [Rickettsiaceae bacterium]